MAIKKEKKSEKEVIYKYLSMTLSLYKGLESLKDILLYANKIKE